MALNNLQGLICHKTKPNQTNKQTVSKIIRPDFFFFFLSAWTRVGRKVHKITSYLLLITFLTRRPKHSNTELQSVWATKEAMLKSEPHLVTFREIILVSLWTFQPILIIKPRYLFRCIFVKKIYNMSTKYS